MWRHRLRSRCEKKEKKLIRKLQIEMDLVDQNDRFNRMR